MSISIKERRITISPFILAVVYQLPKPIIPTFHTNLDLHAILTPKPETPVSFASYVVSRVFRLVAESPASTCLSSNYNSSLTRSLCGTAVSFAIKAMISTNKSVAAIQVTSAIVS